MTSRSSRPETSTVRSALAIRAAADDLLNGEVHPETAVSAVSTLMVEARKLRPDQVEDVMGHLRHTYLPSSERDSLAEGTSRPTPVADAPQA